MEPHRGAAGARKPAGSSALVRSDEFICPHRSTPVCWLLIAPGLISLPRQLVACSTVIISRVGCGHYRKIHPLSAVDYECSPRFTVARCGVLNCTAFHGPLLLAVVGVTRDTSVADGGRVRIEPVLLSRGTARFLGPASRCDEPNTSRDAPDRSIGRPGPAGWGLWCRRPAREPDRRARGIPAG